MVEKGAQGISSPREVNTKLEQAVKSMLRKDKELRKTNLKIEADVTRMKSHCPAQSTPKPCQLLAQWKCQLDLLSNLDVNASPVRLFPNSAAVRKRQLVNFVYGA